MADLISAAGISRALFPLIARGFPSVGVALLAKRDMEHPRRSGLLVDADIALVSINTGTEVALAPFTLITRARGGLH